MGHQSGSNGEEPEVNSHREISPDEIAVHIKHMRESNQSVFSASIDSMDAED